MKILIVGDNHGDLNTILELNHVYCDVDLKLHTGDSCFDYNEIDVLKSYEKVRGNNDFLPLSILPNFEVIGTKYGNIFLTHGHMDRVNFETEKESLRQHAKEFDAKIVVYGHTHILDVQNYDNQIVLNPSSIVFPRSSNVKTYLLVELFADKIVVNVKNTQHQTVEKYEF